MVRNKLDDLLNLVDKAYLNVNEIIDYGKELAKNSLGNMDLYYHQIARLHETIKNGTKRIVLEDTTGSGKTLVNSLVLGLLSKESPKKKVKSLLVAPNQALDTAWTEKEINKYTKEFGLPHLDVMRVENGDISDLMDSDIIAVNYEKLSRKDTNTYENQHIKKIKQILPEIDVLMVDECHNLKNPWTNTSNKFKKIIDKTRGKHVILSSASAVPNKIKDISYLLYMFDPEKYSHYENNEFDPTIDRFSVANARNSPGWFNFERDKLKKILDLPELYFGDEELGIEALHSFELDNEHTTKYFEEWKKQGYAQKMSNLSLILLQSEFNEIINLCEKINEKNPNAQANIFSFYTNGFSKEMAEKLNNKFGEGSASFINGHVPLEERIELAKKFNKGGIKYLVNTTSTVSEAISLVSGDNESYLIFAQPPVVPATFDQGIGRPYRLGQRAPVHVIEMIPESEKLNGLMEEYRDDIKNRISSRQSWTPGTIFKDFYKIRQEKKKAIDRIIKAKVLDYLPAIFNIEDGSSDPRACNSLLSFKDSEEDRRSPNHIFNEGLKAVRGDMGRSVDESLINSVGKGELVDVYSSNIWKYTSSADTNKIVKEIIETIEERKNINLENILDWGSGPACLGRILKRPVHNLDALSEMIDNGKRISQEEGLEGQKFYNQNARDMTFEDNSFDLVTSIYAVQYNSQGSDFGRDIEEILLETNRVMKDNAYGIFALPNEAAVTNVKESVEGMENLLDKYGFNIVFSDYVTGHAMNSSTERLNKVFNGVPIILYQKNENKDLLIEEGHEDIFIYTPYKLKLIGGIRETQLDPYGKGNLNSFYKQDKKNDEGKIEPRMSEEFRINGAANKYLNKAVREALK